jgi:hypothetical protein
MVDVVVLSTLYFISVFQLILQAGVVFYAFRVTKLTGSFRAWTLIIAAFTLLTIRNVVSLVLSLSLPADQLTALINSVGAVTLILSSAVNIAAGVALFLGMFGLVKRFENQSKAPQ